MAISLNRNYHLFQRCQRSPRKIGEDYIYAPELSLLKDDNLTEGSLVTIVSARDDEYTNVVLRKSDAGNAFRYGANFEDLKKNYPEQIYHILWSDLVS